MRRASPAVKMEPVMTSGQSRDARSRLEQARSAVVEAESEYSRSKSDFERFKRLRAENAVTQQQFEQVQARDWLPELHRYLAEHALLTGDLATAGQEAQHALSLARELSMRNEEGYSLRVLAKVEMAEGIHEDAEQHLCSSCAILQELQDEYEWACSELVLARLYHMQGETMACIASLDRCAPVLKRLGAQIETGEIQHLREQARLAQSVTQI